MVNQNIKEVLETSFPRVEERRVDLLTKLEDDTLFHLEIQSVNDSLMPKRMLKYALLIYENYNEFPRQMVLYVGEKKIKIDNQIKEKNLCYNYEVRDIKEFDCSKLIESDDIKDNILAILCSVKDIDKLYERLKEKLLKLENKKREDYLRKFFYLSRLRPKLHEMIEKKQDEELPMPFTIEKERDPLYKNGLRKGIEKGREEGLQRGIKKGLEKGKTTIAKALLKKGVAIDVIVDVTGLKRDEVKALQND